MSCDTRRLCNQSHSIKLLRFACPRDLCPGPSLSMSLLQAGLSAISCVCPDRDHFSNQQRVDHSARHMASTAVSALSLYPTRHLTHGRPSSSCLARAVLKSRDKLGRGLAQPPSRVRSRWVKYTRTDASALRMCPTTHPTIHLLSFLHRQCRQPHNLCRPTSTAKVPRWE